MCLNTVKSESLGGKEREIQEMQMSEKSEQPRAKRDPEIFS